MPRPIAWVGFLTGVWLILYGAYGMAGEYYAETHPKYIVRDCGVSL